MRRLFTLLVAILASLFIAGCGSSGSSAEPPPGGLTLVPGDGIITVSWAMASGVDYWLFYAPAASISTSNWTTIPGSKSVINAGSPQVITGLTNGGLYSFTLDARTHGGPGGSGTASVSAIPRLAGSATANSPVPWTAGTALASSDLRGLMLGTTLVAVGAAGVMYSSPDGVVWTAITPLITTNLNAAIYAGQYNAVGDGGVILRSADAITWVAAASSGTATTKNLYGMGGGPGRIVAVGAAGTIISTVDGTNWTVAAASGVVTTNDLYAVRSQGSVWIAVGAKGTLLTSPDAITWTAVGSNTALDLKSITYGINAATGAGIFVAVGAGGALVTSADAVTWTAQTAIGANTLSAVTYGTQFIAVGAGGSIFTSADGIVWTSQPSASTSDLKAIVHAAYSYSVVGTAGANLLAK
jgi:hypothetical protein